MSYPGPGDITQGVPGLAEARALENGPRTGPPPSVLGDRAFTPETRKPSVPGHLHPCPLTLDDVHQDLKRGQRSQFPRALGKGGGGSGWGSLIFLGGLRLHC